MRLKKYRYYGPPLKISRYASAGFAGFRAIGDQENKQTKSDIGACH